MDTRWIRGRYALPVMASLIVGVLVGFYTGDKVGSLTVGLLVSLTLLLAEHVHTIARVSVYLDLHGDIIDARPCVLAVAKRVKHIADHGDALQVWVAEHALERVASRLRELEDHRWPVPSLEGFVDISTRLFADCRESYRGTSVIWEFEQFWTSALGQQFQDATANAIARGVKVSRIFIFKKIEDVTLMNSVLAEQDRMGIEVWSMLDGAQLIGTPLRDFGVWDGRIAVDLTESREKGSNFQSTFLFASPRSAEFANTFELLRGKATRYRRFAGGGSN